MMETQISNFKSQNCNLKLKTDVKARAYDFALDVINFIDAMPRLLSTDVIAKQLIRSATSIGANIIEAKSSSSKRDFINYYNHALKSSNEVKFWLNLLMDSKKMPQIDIANKIQEVTEIANMLAASILTMKGKNKF